MTRSNSWLKDREAAIKLCTADNIDHPSEAMVKVKFVPLVERIRGEKHRGTGVTPILPKRKNNAIESTFKIDLMKRSNVEWVTTSTGLADNPEGPFPKTRRAGLWIVKLGC